MPPGVVSQTTLQLLAAKLGPESPLPPFSGLQRLPDPSSSPDLPLEMRDRIAYGRLANPLPYALQNGYSRDLRPRDIPAIRLANGRLEALVLPGLGGRLWSLRDLVTERDLVFSNRRLQFANFALTDAWFAGGIEWNLGSTGHSATTSRPVFAGRVESNRGPALRIWEWERTRDLVFSVDLLMPADRSLLLAFVRVRNPDPERKPLYWWTNIAAPEEPGVRVLAPAARAWRTGYDGSIARVDIPFPDEPATDVSYPLLAQRAADYFFEVPPERRAWIAAVQADGRSVRTVEALAGADGQLHPLQEAFRETHALQCGFCTPGFLMSLESYLRENQDPDEHQIREALAGNICRCTGYAGIVEAVSLAARRLRAHREDARGSTR